VTASLIGLTIGVVVGLAWQLVAVKWINRRKAKGTPVVREALDVYLFAPGHACPKCKYPRSNSPSASIADAFGPKLMKEVNGHRELLRYKCPACAAVYYTRTADYVEPTPPPAPMPSEPAPKSGVHR
jgi:phage FluMu protein Com